MARTPLEVRSVAIVKARREGVNKDGNSYRTFEYSCIDYRDVVYDLPDEIWNLIPKKKKEVKLLGHVEKNTKDIPIFKITSIEK